MVSVGAGGKDVGGVTLPILKVGRPFADKREFRTVSKVPCSSQFLTVAMSTLITALETLLFSKVGIDCIGIVMSGPLLVLTEVIGEEWPTLLLCANRWPVAEALAYLHVQISPISCNVVGSILHVLGKKH